MIMKHAGHAIAVCLTIAGVLAAGPLAANSSLPPLSHDVAGAWRNYVRAAEQRIAGELAAADKFLVLDFAPDALASRRTLTGGGLVIEPVKAVDGRGTTLTVPGAMVHHWRGAVLIPGTTLADVLRTLQEGGVLGARQEDVLAARVLDRRGDTMRVSLKLRRTKFVTVVYDTEHAVRFTRHGPHRASSTSTAVKIAELAAALTPAEHEVAPGDDRGYLWRWQAYWRYEQVAGGVLAECESISLSRDIPAMVRYLVRPMVERTARESLERTLATLRRMQ